MSRVRLTARSRSSADQTPYPGNVNQPDRKDPAVDQYHTFEQRVNHELPDMRHDWQNDGRDDIGFGIPESWGKSPTVASVRVAANKAVRVAMLLLGEKVSDEVIEKQAQDLMAMGPVAMDRTLQRFADTQKLYAADEEKAEEKKAADEKDEEKKAADGEAKFTPKIEKPGAEVKAAEEKKDEDKKSCSAADEKKDEEKKAADEKKDDGKDMKAMIAAAVAEALKAALPDFIKEKKEEAKEEKKAADAKDEKSEEKKAADEKKDDKAEAKCAADEAKKDEEKKAAEEAKKDEESKKAADEAKKDEESKKAAEEAKKDEEAKKASAKKSATEFDIELSAAMEDEAAPDSEADERLASILFSGDQGAEGNSDRKVEATQKKAGISKLGGQPRVASAGAAGVDISSIWQSAPDVSEAFK